MTPSDRMTIWRKDNFNRARLHNILSGCKIRARKKNVEFDLTYEWFKHRAIDVGVCEDTGIEFDHEAPTTKNKNHPFSPSIDRRDPTKGYTQDNCRVVIWMHNRAKGEDDIGILYYYAKELIRAIEG